MLSEDDEPLSPVLGGLAAGSRGSEDDLGAPVSSGLADDSDGSWARPSSDFARQDMELMAFPRPASHSAGARH